MTEADLYPLLSHLADGQVYPYVAPLSDDGQPSISAPWVIFSLVSDVSTDVLCGQAESRVYVQIDIYSLTIVEATAIRDDALRAVKVLNPGNISKTPGYEPDHHLYRSTIEFQVIA